MDRVRSARLQLSALKDKLAKTFLRPASIKVMERIPHVYDSDAAGCRIAAP